MVTVCPSQFATRRTLFHVLVGCGLLMLKVSRSEERFSRNAETDLVCRLLLEKKKMREGRVFTTQCTIRLACMIHRNRTESNVNWITFTALFVIVNPRKALPVGLARS